MKNGYCKGVLNLCLSFIWRCISNLSKVYLTEEIKPHYRAIQTVIGCKFYIQLMELSLFLHARTLHWMKISGQSFYCKALKLQRLQNVTRKRWKCDPTILHRDSMENFKLDLQFLNFKCFVLDTSGPSHILFLSLFPSVFTWLAPFYQSHLGLNVTSHRGLLQGHLTKETPSLLTVILQHCNPDNIDHFL